MSMSERRGLEAKLATLRAQRREIDKQTMVIKSRLKLIMRETDLRIKNERLDSIMERNIRILHRRAEGLTLQAIADEFGLSKGHVAVAIHLAKRKLWFQRKDHQPHEPWPRWLHSSDVNAGELQILGLLP